MYVQNNGAIYIYIYIHPIPRLCSKFDPSCQQGCIVLNSAVLISCGGCERLVSHVKYLFNIYYSDQCVVCASYPCDCALTFSEI